MTEWKAPPTKEEQEKLIMGVLTRYQAYDPDEYIAMEVEESTRLISGLQNRQLDVPDAHYFVKINEEFRREGYGNWDESDERDVLTRLQSIATKYEIPTHEIPHVDGDCELVVYYDGCHDEGMVGRDAYSGGFERRFDNSKPNEPVTLSNDEEDAFGEFLHAWLGDRSPGWEINEGSSGTAHFYIHGGRISVYCNHDVNVMEVRSGVLR